jgi:sphingomyelin phosphodiesterase acid-like 3
VKYNRKSGHVIDIEQYYLNLTAANAARTANWTLEYRFTEYFGLNDVTTAALDQLAGQLMIDDNQFSRYYQINDAHFPKRNAGSGTTAKTWTDDERMVHSCAVSNVEYSDYDKCIYSHTPSVGGSTALRGHVTTVVKTLLTLFAIANMLLQGHFHNMLC